MDEQPRDADALIERMFEQPMLDAANETGKIKRLNLSQAVNDQRISLHRAYADGCQIIIICSFEGDEDYFGDQFLLLKDSEGSVFWATGSQNDYLEGVGQFSAITFDASEYRGNAEELTLHFEIDIPTTAENDLRRGFMRRMGRSGSYSFGLGGGLMQHRKGIQRPSLEEWREQHRTGLQQQGVAFETFAFDFSVPFTPARIFDSEPQVEVNGVKVTLKRVVVAPSTTRIVVAAEDVKDDSTWRFHMAQAVLGVPDEKLGLALQMKSSNGEATIFRTAGALYNKQGEWTLTITQLQAFLLNRTPPLDSNGRPDPSYMKQIRRWHFDGFNTLLGPWVFKFTMPPASE